MTASTEILQFAGGGGANVLTQANYAALATILENGYPAGILDSNLLNKTLRQSNFMAVGLAGFLVSKGISVPDDGNIAALAANIAAAIAPEAVVAAGTADAITVALLPTAVAFSAAPIWWRATAANATTTPTIKRDGLAAKTIVKGANAALAVGDIPGAGAWMCSQYDVTFDKEVLLNPATGVTPVASLPSGAIVHVAQNTAPDGFLKANGAAISRITYAALFSAIGTTFGVGDGSTTFNVPDLRGEVVRGWDDSRGVDSGRVFGSAQGSRMQSHSHTCNGGAFINNDFENIMWAAGAGGNFGYSTATDAVGGTSNGSENRMRNVALLACIKY